ncbi:MAG TPA: helix-turn-helix domain-containing protein [Polyangiaceae bacterium]|jgi:flagellar biosynthesis protein FlhG|nr:helix-turn-helix domain-containing protein [Polyangiaceae bacterium]
MISNEYGSTYAVDDGSGEPRAKRLGCVVAVGAGRGGVGKSLVAVNLAVYLAQLGRAVVLVDADPGGSNLHSHFGLSAARAEPDLSRDATAAIRNALVSTSVPGLSLLPAAHDALTKGLTLRARRKTRWFAALRGLLADYVVIDVGPGHADPALDFMLSADIPIAVTVPEPPAIETTYRFLRVAFRRRLKRMLVRDRLRSSIVDRAFSDLGALPPPIDVVRKLIPVDRSLAELAWAEAQALRVQLVVNQTRVRTDAELGSWMSGLVSRHYGVVLDELGHIEHDDTVWLTVRRNKPLLIDSPACKSARNVERIARRVLALTLGKTPDRAALPSAPVGEPTLYAVLGVTRSASDDEIRRAYKRQREIYATGGLATVSLLDGHELSVAQRKLEEAYDTLLDGVRRRAYDLSTFPDQEPLVLSARATRPALAAEQLMLQEQLQREIGPDTEFTGSLLRKVRESQGLELADVSAKSRIARAYLQAIEEEHYEELPALVYTRGYLVEFAKQLRLDPAQVHRTYLRRLRDAMAARRKELV